MMIATSKLNALAASLTNLMPFLILVLTSFPPDGCLSTCAPKCNCTRIPSRLDSDVCRWLSYSNIKDVGKCICPGNGLIPDEFLDVLCLEVEFEDHAVLDNESFTNQSFGSLRGLALSGVQYIKPGGFRAVAGISQLFFRNSFVVVVENSVFTYLGGLSEIHADNNKINALQDGCFQGLAHLSLLNLANNSISDISRDNFIGLTMLQTLDLSRNNIARIEPQTFELMPKLSALNLSTNIITRIDRGAFLNLNKLETLDLNGNQIQVISEPQFQESKINKVIIYIRNNPLQCDCRMNWINSWINIEGPHCSGTCVSPEEVKGDTLLEAYKEPMSQCKDNNSKINVKKGDKATLHCPFAYASWVVPDRPNVTLHESRQSDSHYFLTNGDSLVIWNTQPKHKGFYTCITEDGDHSVIYYLGVGSSPTEISIIILSVLSGILFFLVVYHYREYFYCRKKGCAAASIIELDYNNIN